MPEFSPQSRVGNNFLHDGLCEDRQEKIEGLISRRRDCRLNVLQRCLVIAYTPGFRIAACQQQNTDLSVHPPQVERPNATV
jgi:hypothetical protein